MTCNFSKKFTAYIIAVISVISAMLLSSCKDEELSANEIYENCLYNVVEIKAESENVGESFGTGEILYDDGRIITNAHVVTYSSMGFTNEFEKYYMRFSFEEDYRELSLIKYDTDLDIAVLQIKDITGLTLKPVSIGSSNEIKSGDKVYAVGNASNYGIGIFEGIVSVPLVNLVLDGQKRSVIQCDLTIAAGNSGGALINGKGELVGITTFRTKDTSGNVVYGIAYCIPVNAVTEFVC